MPANKVEPTVLKTAAEGEAKAKRARNVQKTPASKASAEGTLELAEKPAGKTPPRKTSRKNSTALTETSAPIAQGNDGGLHLLFSTEDVSVRAYFIGEHRRSLGICGDSEGDWLEAERQLKSEALGIAASLRKK